MSKTIVDMPKVAQMLDSGWHVKLYKGGLGSYVAVGLHPDDAVMDRLAKHDTDDWPGMFVDDDGECTTDDFTPEQALTRLAYKVHGEILR